MLWKATCHVFKVIHREHKDKHPCSLDLKLNEVERPALHLIIYPLKKEPLTPTRAHFITVSE